MSLIASVGLSAASAQAMPVAPPATLSTSGVVQQVADGCGPDGHRSHYGYCKPNGYGEGYGYDRPRFYGGPTPDPGYYGPRPGYGPRCFIRDTYDGPRRICRW